MTSERFTLPPQGGVLLIDKVGDWTSHDVVAKARRALGTRKVGHAGTLDPMATGLLVLGAGPATRLLTYLVGLDKTYEATIRLGATTVTDDREGDVIELAPTERLESLCENPERISEAAKALTGDILQAPSAVSAIKVDGRRAYDRVRSGETVELARRPVTIHEFELGEPRRVELDGGVAVDIDARIRCSTGTYVRALARDLGGSLDVGGHLTALRRTEVGPFRVTDALPHEALLVADFASAGEGALLAPADVASALFPRVSLTEQQSIDLGHGKRVDLDVAQVSAEQRDRTELAAAIAPSGRLVGLVSIRHGVVKPVTNFPTPDASGGA